MPDPSLLPVHELSAAIQCRRLSPVDLVEAHLARIEAKEPKLHAFVEVYAEESVSATKQPASSGSVKCSSSSSVSTKSVVPIFPSSASTETPRAWA